MYAALSQAGVKAPTQRKVGTTLNVALNAAVDLRVIRANPAARLKKPRHTPPEMRPLDPSEVGRLLSAASGDRLYGLYAVALDTGMGPGELFGLHWPDVDLATGYVQVRRSLEEIGGKHRLKDVKAKARRRRIKLTAFGRDALAAHRARMRAEGGTYRPGRSSATPRAGSSHLERHPRQLQAGPRPRRPAPHGAVLRPAPHLRDAALARGGGREGRGRTAGPLDDGPDPETPTSTSCRGCRSGRRRSWTRSSRRRLAVDRRNQRLSRGRISRRFGLFYLVFNGPGWTRTTNQGIMSPAGALWLSVVR
jgi:hypothetical protein